MTRLRLDTATAACNTLCEEARQFDPSNFAFQTFEDVFTLALRRWRQARQEVRRRWLPRGRVRPGAVAARSAGGTKIEEWETNRACMQPPRKRYTCLAAETLLMFGHGPVIL